MKMFVLTMKKLRLVFILAGILFFITKSHAQVAYVDTKDKQVIVSPPQFYITGIRDGRIDTVSIGSVYSLKFNKYIPVKFVNNAGTALHNMLAANSVAGDSLLPVVINIKKVSITEDTAARRKAGNVKIVLGFEKMFDGKLTECYESTGEIETGRYLQNESATFYARSITSCIDGIMQSFNDKLVNKEISKDSITKITGIVFGQIKPQGTDTITWDAARPLQTTDFAAKIPEGRRSADVFSASATDFSVDVNNVANPGGITITINTAALFIRHLSWMRLKGRVDEFALPFEQLKFDLAKLYEIRLVKSLKAASFTYAGFNQQFHKIHQDIHIQFSNDMANMVADCQNANSYSVSKKRFQEWKIKIAAALQAENQ